MSDYSADFKREHKKLMKENHELDKCHRSNLINHHEFLKEHIEYWIQNLSQLKSIRHNLTNQIISKKFKKLNQRNKLNYKYRKIESLIKKDQEELKQLQIEIDTNDKEIKSLNERINSLDDDIESLDFKIAQVDFSNTSESNSSYEHPNKRAKLSSNSSETSASTESWFDNRECINLTNLYRFSILTSPRSLIKFNIDLNLEFKYEPIEWPLNLNDKEATSSILESFSVQFDSFLKENGSSIKQLGVRFDSTQNNLESAMSNVSIDDFKSFQAGIIDGILVPIEEQSNRNSDIMTTCFGIIKINKNGMNTSQLLLQLINATVNSCNPVFVLRGNINECIEISFFISGYLFGDDLLLYRSCFLKPAVAFKMIHLWISVICNDKQSDNAHFNESRAQILAGQQKIKDKYAEIKSKQSLEISLDVENVQPTTEEDDIEATDEQVDTNMIIFNYIRSQKRTLNDLF